MDALLSASLGVHSQWALWAELALALTPLPAELVVGVELEVSTLVFSKAALRDSGSRPSWLVSQTFQNCIRQRIASEETKRCSDMNEYYLVGWSSGVMEGSKIAYSSTVQAANLDFSAKAASCVLHHLLFALFLWPSRPSSGGHIGH